MEEIIYNFFNSRALYDSLPFLARGMIVTVQLALVSLGFSLLVGLFVAVLRHRNFKVVNWFLIAYIDIFSSSGRATTNATEVNLIKLMDSLVSGGMAIRRA